MADYKKRKELKEYLPHEEHWKLKSDRKSVEKTPPVAQHSPNSTAVDTESKEEEGEGGKRSIISEEDEEPLDVDSETQSRKKCKYDNGEKEATVNGETAGRENGAGKGAAA